MLLRRLLRTYFELQHEVQLLFVDEIIWEEHLQPCSNDE